MTPFSGPDLSVWFAGTTPEFSRSAVELTTWELSLVSSYGTSHAFQLSPKPQKIRRSGTKNEPKPKLLSPDIFRWGRGLPHEGVGAKKFGMPLETREIKLFWRDIPGFRRDIPGAPEKFEKKWFGFNIRSLEDSLIGHLLSQTPSIRAPPLQEPR